MNTVTTQSHILDLTAQLTGKVTSTAAQDNIFQNILEGAMQQEVTEAVPLSQGQTRQETQEPTKAPKGEGTGQSVAEEPETEHVEPELAQAAMLASIIVVPPDPEVILVPEIESGGESPSVGDTAPTAPIVISGDSISAAENPMQQATIVPPATETPLQPPVQQAPTQQQPNLTGVSVATPEELPAVMEQIPVITLPVITDTEEAQQSFDARLEQAARELAGGEPQPEITDSAPSEEPDIAPEGPALPEEAAPEDPTPESQVPPEAPESEEAPIQKLAVETAPRETEIRTPQQAEEELPITFAPVTRPEAAPTSQVTQVPDKAAQPDTPARQIEAQVIEHLEQDMTEFRMQLNPEHLGRIDVKLVLESGHLTVEILSATAKTTELLSRQAEGLAASLRLSGTDLHTVQVVTETQAQSQHMDQAMNMMLNQQQHETGQDKNAGSATNRTGSASPALENEMLGTEAAPAAQPKRLLDYAV